MIKKIRLSISDILFEDENYLAVNKQSAWTLRRDELLKALRSFVKQRDKLSYQPRIRQQNDLKSDESGVILFVKNESIRRIKVNIQKSEKHLKTLSFIDPLSKNEIVIKAEVVSEDSNVSGEKLYVLFNKPFDTLCQFTKDNESQSALCDFNLPKNIYPAGRLDKDSEGLLLLTNDGPLINDILSPKNKKNKTYHVQVENIPDGDSLRKLEAGVEIKGGYKTRPAKVRILENFDIPARVPPIRERKAIPTCWLEVIICEGKNRQVRQMTAAIGHPTLRLIRVGVGNLELPKELSPGEFLEIKRNDI